MVTVEKPQLGSKNTSEATISSNSNASQTISCKDVIYGSENYNENMEKLMKIAEPSQEYFTKYDEAITSLLCDDAKGSVDEIKKYIDGGYIKISTVNKIAKILVAISEYMPDAKKSEFTEPNLINNENTESKLESDKTSNKNSTARTSDMFDCKGVRIIAQQVARAKSAGIAKDALIEHMTTGIPAGLNRRPNLYLRLCGAFS